MSDLDQATQRIENDEAWLETDEVVQLEAKRALDKVVPVRLSSEQWDQLRREAREIGVGPSTLIRMWILEKLREGAAQTRGV